MGKEIVQLNRTSKQIYVSIHWIILLIKDKSYILKAKRKLFQYTEDSCIFLHYFIYWKFSIYKKKTLKNIFQSCVQPGTSVPLML